MSAGSFGIEVAKLAQLPLVIIERSQSILKSMEGQAKTIGATRVLPKQGNIFNDELLERIASLEKELEKYKGALERIRNINL